MCGAASFITFLCRTSLSRVQTKSELSISNMLVNFVDDSGQPSDQENQRGDTHGGRQKQDSLEKFFHPISFSGADLQGG